MIKALSESDAIAASQLHAQGFETGWDVKTFGTYFVKDLCFGYFKDKRLLAFIVCAVAVDQAEIITIVTHPDQRGKGYARALLDVTVKELITRGVTVLF